MTTTVQVYANGQPASDPVDIDGVTFTVRGGPFDVARLDPMPVREDPRGAMPDPPTTKTVGPGESVEGEIRVTAVQTGTLVFTAVYVCQALDGPLTCVPTENEVCDLSPKAGTTGGTPTTTTAPPAPPTPGPRPPTRCTPCGRATGGTDRGWCWPSPCR